MRDGTDPSDKLIARRARNLSVLLERTPYGKHQSIMVSIQAPQFLAQHGFVVAIRIPAAATLRREVGIPFARHGEKSGMGTTVWVAGHSTLVQWQSRDLRRLFCRIQSVPLSG
jgi:hypothetical protein